LRGVIRCTTDYAVWAPDSMLELEIHSFLHESLQEKHKDVRSEFILASNSRADLVVFDDAGDMVCIVEVKMARLNETLSESDFEQCHRYALIVSPVPVYLIAGMAEAEQFMRDWPNVGHWTHVCRKQNQQFREDFPGISNMSYKGRVRSVKNMMRLQMCGSQKRRRWRCRI